MAEKASVGQRALSGVAASQRTGWSLKRRSFLACMLLFGVAACGPQSPSDAFPIPSSELGSVESAANAGDLAASKRLIAHYDATTGNERIAEKWRAQARALGDAEELYGYAATLQADAMSESGPVRKRAILTEAYNYASRSYRGNPDVTTKELMNDPKGTTAPDS